MLTRILATTALALTLAAPAAAQRSDESQPAPQSSAQERDRGAQAVEDRPTRQLTLAGTADLAGSAVRNQDGDQIGEIEDLIVDVRKGELAYAIVGVGGFLGVGQKSVAVPWERLRRADQPQTFVMNVDRQTLENAPAIDADSLAQLEDPEARRRIAAFWQRAESQQAERPDRPGSEERNGNR